VMILSDVHGVASESQDIRLSSRTNERYTEKDKTGPSSSPSSSCEKPLVALAAIHNVFRKAAFIVKGLSSCSPEGSAGTKIPYLSAGYEQLQGHHLESNCGLSQR
jgi:hypothetical protein